jgi:hypothetical protein
MFRTEKEFEPKMSATRMFMSFIVVSHYSEANNVTFCFTLFFGSRFAVDGKIKTKWGPPPPPPPPLLLLLPPRKKRKQCAAAAAAKLSRSNAEQENETDQNGAWGGGCGGRGR